VRDYQRVHMRMGKSMRMAASPDVLKGYGVTMV
jgi:hypothetical protein